MSNLNQLFITDLGPEDIPWQELRSCFELWLSKRDGRELPTRQEFTMHNLKRVLPFVTIFSVEHDPLRFTYSLVGTAITEMMGYDITGKAINDYPHLETSKNNIEWLVNNRKPYFIKDSPTIWAKKDYQNFSVLSLPLSDDGEVINKIITICHFHD